MEKLEALKPITRISDKVVRILGQNPGKFTLQGTNTYIVGASNPYILVDTGEGKPEYPPTLRTALENPRHPSLPDISDIILTHRHHDHIRGLPSVLGLCRDLWAKRNPETPFSPPRIHKFPLPMPNSDLVLNELQSGLKEGRLPFRPREAAVSTDLADGQKLTASVLPPGSNPNDWTLEVLHCPGHTADSVSLLFAADRALFTGDAVLGQGTATIRAYIDHRLERESQVLAVLGTTPPEGSWTTWTIVSSVYERYPESLNLEREGRVRFLGGELKEARWELVH
ncbi:Metallo-hydrolase/oxidoreductase [Lactarius deliciosus]|nr:Metallo-hydrolase/oxidoreductase [Lactarius deliciosus]